MTTVGVAVSLGMAEAHCGKPRVYVALCTPVESQFQTESALGHALQTLQDVNIELVMHGQWSKEAEG